jgi:hypothetical protein
MVLLTVFLCDITLAVLTKKFIDLLNEAEDGILDLNNAAEMLDVGTFPLLSLQISLSHLSPDAIF